MGSYEETVRCVQPGLTQLKQLATRESKRKINLVLCERALSPARHVLKDTSHQTRPKIDAGDANLLMGSIN
jgi:hypothetical protein